MVRTFLAALLVVTQVAFAAEEINYLTRPAELESWRIEQHESAVVQPAKEGDAIVLNVTTPSTEAWHVQVYQPSLSLQEGKPYTIRFRAKADAERSYTVNVSTGVPDYHTVSPVFTFQCTTQWKEFSFPFTASNVVEGASRGPLFALGARKGTLYLADVALMGPRREIFEVPMPNSFFQFALKWDDTSTGVATDVSFLNEKPAGKNGHIVVRDGHFVEENTGKRMRMFGTNMGAAEAFPTKADAELIAKRLAKNGVNIVRLHHLDNPWAIQSGGSIWDRTRADRQELDPAQLDKFDYLIAKLKEQGIYVNLNLKVSKELSAADGMPESIREVTFSHQKRIDFFQKRMIELQKDYARKLLAHRNPYTGMTYTEDPVVAVVEINNENSLLGFWTPTLGKGLETLPEAFKAELEGYWTAWLKRKYETDAKVREAWMAGQQVGGSEIFSPEQTWVAEAQGQAKLQLTPTPAKEGAAPYLVADVQAVDGTDWHVQAKLQGLTLTEGQLYTLSFKVKADRDRNIAIAVNKDIADWHNMGLSETIKLSAGKPQEVVTTFRAQSVEPEHARLSFTLGQAPGKVEILDLQLSPGAKGAGLKDGESVDGRVSIPRTALERQWKDWIHFLVDTERSYSDQMLAVLKDELKVKANVALTQLDYGGTGGLNREKRMDFADAHAYWQHPTFPNRDWSASNWRITNTPQIAEFADRAFGELGNISLFRVAGKPFTVSEYDHPAPSDYVSEMMPTYATFACVQDWDIIYNFAIGSYNSEAKPDRILGYFDQTNHPAKWSLNPMAALVFRQGLIEPAKASATLRLPAPIWESYHMFGDAWRKLIPEGPLGFLTRRLAVSDEPLPAGEKPRVVEEGQPAEGQVHLQKAGSGQVYIAASPAAAVFAGYIGGETLKGGDVELRTEAFGNNFASVAAVATDGQPLSMSKRILVTVCGRVENQGMKWNDSRTSVGTNWGYGPTIAQYVPATLSLPPGSARKAFILDSTGKRVKDASAKIEGDRLVLSVQDTDQTLLYEIAE